MKLPVLSFACVRLQAMAAWATAAEAARNSTRKREPHCFAVLSLSCPRFLLCRVKTQLKKAEQSEQNRDAACMGPCSCLSCDAFTRVCAAVLESLCAILGDMMVVCGAVSVALYAQVSRSLCQAVSESHGCPCRLVAAAVFATAAGGHRPAPQRFHSGVCVTSLLVCC